MPDLTNINYDPNARYDNGPNAAGAGRVSNQETLQNASASGLTPAGVLGAANLRVGFNAAGVSRDNIGPNAAGQPPAFFDPGPA